MIELKGVRKSYGANEVLKGVDLGIEEQDYLVILGASGSGKSTLLNILSGLEKPDQGEVLYDGENIASLNESKLTKFRKDHIAFILQQYYLLQELTVEQNVKMGAHLAKNKDYLPIIDAMGLKEKLHQYPSELSGGEQQRIAIARALAKKPKVLFLDEPTGALDEASGRQILSYIAQMKKELGFTLVMVTHNEHIAKLANTVVRVNSGQIQDIVVNEEPKSVEEIGW
ncbi:ABC transporter ATP-binding protein [Streptococcus gordonii]|uniref:ABC transporter ATP-binding protein n=1 Tax=Streptococcus gordonii TaxID=1302 RepID=UPI0020010F96|nr:ABC transporter ATP-binding protein [Streptococcus gordonii]